MLCHISSHFISHLLTIFFTAVNLLLFSSIDNTSLIFYLFFKSHIGKCYSLDFAIYAYVLCFLLMIYGLTLKTETSNANLSFLIPSIFLGICTKKYHLMLIFEDAFKNKSYTIFL